MVKAVKHAFNGILEHEHASICFHGRIMLDVRSMESYNL